MPIHISTCTSTHMFILMSTCISVAHTGDQFTHQLEDSRELSERPVCRMHMHMCAHALKHACMMQTGGLDSQQQRYQVCIFNSALCCATACHGMPCHTRPHRWVLDGGAVAAHSSAHTSDPILSTEMNGVDLSLMLGWFSAPESTPPILTKRLAAKNQFSHRLFLFWLGIWVPNGSSLDPHPTKIRSDSPNKKRASAAYWSIHT